AWGVDGHNSHTNICSSSARAGYQFWMGYDRPSPDHANADVILLISAHLESGHYFNPHAQRVMEGKQRGAKLIVFDVRLSNTATHADHWLAPYPGSEAAILLAIARHMIREGRYDREFVRRWWNWEEYLDQQHPTRPAADPHAAASAEVERPHLARRVSARLQRALVPPSAVSEGRPRNTRRLLQPRLQPGLDEPRRVLVDRGAHRRNESRTARRVDADLERDRLL